MMTVSEWAMFLQSCRPKRADNLYFYRLFLLLLKLAGVTLNYQNN
uniref:Uncharacterized protein n=1 Tax=Anguilla anguilla TaxID=7936 RepID=A0A0E9PAL3_ANGAN